MTAAKSIDILNTFVPDTRNILQHPESCVAGNTFQLPPSVGAEQLRPLQGSTFPTPKHVYASEAIRPCFEFKSAGNTERMVDESPQPKS